MSRTGPPRLRLTGRLSSRRTVARGLRRVDLELPRPVAFAPGQFAMLNFPGPDHLTFGRPLSILEAAGGTISFLYRVVGRGTRRLDEAAPGTPVEILAPLGSAFPPPAAAERVVLAAGGCGLPPLWSWWQRHRRGQDRAWFGAREAAEAPWELLAGWRVALESGEAPPGRGEIAPGRVIDACGADGELGGGGPVLLLACGPRPMLAAAARLARERGWGCLVSVEEQMGCGYGVCRGCVVPTTGGGHLAACADGPVLPASVVEWDAFGAGERADAPPPPSCHGRPPGEQGAA